MDPTAHATEETDAAFDQPPVPCKACRDALTAPTRESVSFLLLDQFTLPVVGCSDHLDQFRAVCGLTTEGRAKLLTHRPAGGVPCPQCRLSVHGTGRALIPVDGGAAVVLGCAEHQSTIADRYRTGQETRQQLFGDIDSLGSV